jgi:hypothetical protein
MTVNSLEIYAFGKRGGNSFDIEGGNRVVADEAGAGGGGKVYLADQDAFDIGELNNGFIFFQPDFSRPNLTAEQILDFAEMTGTVALAVDIYGDDPREAMFGTTQIVSECFDTLSDSTSYDGALILWNAPRYSYSAGDPTLRTMRVFIDTVKAGSGGFPDIGTVEAPDGSFTLNSNVGFTQEVPEVDTMGPVAAYEMSEVLPASSGSLGKRFVRVRILFNPETIVDPTDPNYEDILLAGGAAPGDMVLIPGGIYPGFAPAGAAPLPIADDPDTAGLENTRGNLDTAPAGVPAIAEVRVTFTP